MHPSKFAPFIVALALTACASSGRKIDQSKVDQIKKGSSTKEQVLALIGTPEKITKDGDGNTTFSYHYVYASAKGESFIPIVGMFAGGVNTKEQSVTVKFGPDGEVPQVESSVGASDVSQGASTAQPSAKSQKPVEEGKRPR